MQKYYIHPSIKVKRENVTLNLVNIECIIKTINNSKTSKSSQQSDISSKVIKTYF